MNLVLLLRCKSLKLAEYGVFPKSEILKLFNWLGPQSAKKIIPINQAKRLILKHCRELAEDRVQGWSWDESRFHKLQRF